MGLVSSLGRDLKFALRQMRQTPIVSGVALLSLALGIGANVAIFSLVNALILKPLPIHEPDRLVQLQLVEHQPARQHDVVHQPAVGVHPRSPGRLDRRDRGRQRASFNLNAGGEIAAGARACSSADASSTCWASRRSSAAASPRTTIGAAAQPVAVLSYGFWQREYGGDRAGARPPDVARRPCLHDHRRHAAGLLRRARRPHVRRHGAARHRADHPRRRELARSPQLAGG